MAQESYRYLQEQIEKQKEQIRDQTAMLLRMSYEDSLTGVYNRNKFNEIMEPDWSKTKSRLGVAYFDLNGLKAINDSQGHSVGDQFSAVRPSSCGAYLRKKRTAQAEMSLLWWMTPWKKLHSKRPSVLFCGKWSR